MINFIELLKRKQVPNLVRDIDVKFLLKSSILPKIDEILGEIEKKAKSIQSTDFIMANLDLIDEKKFYLYNAYLIKDNLGENSREFKSAMSMISPKDKKIIMYTKTDKLYGLIERNKTTVISYDTLNNIVKENKRYDFFTRLKDKYNVSQMMTAIMLEDIGVCVRDDIVDDEWSKYCISTNLKSRIIFNSILRKSGMSDTQVKNYMLNNEEKFIELGKKYVNTPEGLDEINKILYEYSDWIDFDKLFMFNAYRQIEWLETRNNSAQATAQVKENLINIKKYFDEESKKKKNYSINIKYATSRRKNINSEEFVYSYSDLFKDINRFVGNEYISDVKRKEYIDRIKSGELKISDLSEDLITVLELSKEELMEIGSKNNENYLYYLSTLNDRDILNEIENKDDFSVFILL